MYQSLATYHINYNKSQSHFHTFPEAKLRLDLLLLDKALKESHRKTGY